MCFNAAWGESGESQTLSCKSQFLPKKLCSNFYKEKVTDSVLLLWKTATHLKAIDVAEKKKKKKEALKNNFTHINLIFFY